MTIDFDADDFEAFVIAPQADLPQEGQGKEAEHQQTNLRQEHANKIGFDLSEMKDQAVLEGLRQDNAQSMLQACQDQAQAAGTGARMSQHQQDDVTARQNQKAIAPQADLPVREDPDELPSGAWTAADPDSIVIINPKASPDLPGCGNTSEPLETTDSISPSGSAKTTDPIKSPEPIKTTDPTEAPSPFNTSEPLKTPEILGNCSVTGSDTDLEAATRNQLIELVQALRNDVVRLNRRIHELGGNPPKRDRAAYMRQYRSRLKGAMSGKAPDLGVKFV